MSGGPGEGEAAGRAARPPLRYRLRPRRRQRLSSPESVGSLLDWLLERRHLKAPLRIYKLQAEWRALVGDVAAGRSFPVSLEKGRLVVGVADSTWMQELTFLKGMVLERVRALLGSGVVAGLRFRVQPGVHTPEPQRTALAEPERVDPEEELRRRPLAPDVAEALSRLEEDLERVANPDLRRSIRRAFVKHLLDQA